ncbi:hypothetical protein O9A_00063 [Bartonella koehlerae C-29]|uniref:Uncharacterized protein n=1 Tax=Bartonella koehlerae C-29 TaxID=1134510 RepID=A0A067W9T4_9HYPH|nr:hypothetical protein O9A_00063 [Bartonella koehlerae C-29]
MTLFTILLAGLAIVGLITLVIFNNMIIVGGLVLIFYQVCEISLSYE